MISLKLRLAESADSLTIKSCAPPIGGRLAWKPDVQELVEPLDECL